jgi:hypothetical protein
MSSRLLIIHHEGNIKYNPNLYYFTKILIENGYKVEILSRWSTGIYQGKLFEGADFILYKSEERKDILRVKFELLKRKYCCIIGIDEGIIDAHIWSKIYNIPYVFLSYEIFFDDELNILGSKYYNKIKKRSVKACKSISFAIVQDEKRKELLAKEYNIDPEKIQLMPVAGRGIQQLDKSDYFYNKLKIPINKKILLYMGWIDNSQIKRLCEFALYLPLDWVIVIHSKYKHAEYYNEYLNDHKGKIYLSFDTPIETIEDMGTMLSGVDAGLCTYKATYDSPYLGKNIEYIGMSSGKTSTFLQHGIPIVVNNMNIWDELVEKENIGINVGHIKDLKKLDELLNDEIKKNCLDFFSANLDVTAFSDKIINKIKKFESKKNRINYLFLLFLFNEDIVKTVKLFLKNIKLKLSV